MQPERSQPVDDERRRHAFTMASAPPTLRLTEWPFDPTIAMLVQADHTIDINTDELVSLIDRASSKGVRKIRTGALRATSVERVISHGFHVIDELALLRFDFAAPLPQIRPEGELRHLRRRHLRNAEAVDLDAFGPKWGQHREALARHNERPCIRAVAVAATTKMSLLGLRYRVTPIMSATYSALPSHNAIRGVASDFHCRVTPCIGCTNAVVITPSSTRHCRMTTR